MLSALSWYTSYPVFKFVNKASSVRSAEDVVFIALPISMYLTG